MTAYVILDIDITNPELFEAYGKLAPASIAAFGGRYLARGGASEGLEGDWSPNRIVILEFGSTAIAKRWLDSPEYREALSLRQKAACSRTIVVEGVWQDP